MACRAQARLTRVPGIVAGEPDRLLSGFINGIMRVPCSSLPAARQVLDGQGELCAGHRQCQRRGGRLELRDDAVSQRGDAHPAGRFVRAEHGEGQAGDAVPGETQLAGSELRGAQPPVRDKPS